MKNGSKTLTVCLKIMRLSFYQFLLSVWTCTWVLATNGSAQELLNQRLSVSIENQNLDYAIRKISKVASVRFVYSPQQIKAERKINLNAQNQPLATILETLFKPLNISYEVNGAQILLRQEHSAAIIPQQSTFPEPQSVDISVSGTVTDEKNEPMPGVSVAIKNTTRGTTTDPNGRFILSIPDESAVLVFSFLGYEKQEVAVGSRKTLTIQLRPDPKSLQEVVVVGYGTQNKATLTGSVATVDAKTFQDRGPVASPLAALQGQVAGVTVTRSSSQPGREGWNFQIRGAASINSTEPLVIVDGLPVPGVSALNSFNPNDIENISFLKDAAASIYGSRAAGGVVLITTKRAKNGKPRIEYNVALSQKNIGLLPKLVDINGWGPLIKEARETDGFPATDIWFNFANVAIAAKQKGIDWMTKAQYDAMSLQGASLFSDVKDFTFFNGTEQDVLWGKAHSQEHQLSISGRSDKSGYRISLGFLNDGSLLQPGNNSNKRYNLRLAHDYQFSKKLNLESNLSIERNTIVQPTRLGDALNNGNQPGKPLSGLGLTGLPYVWGSGIGNASVNSIASYGGDNTESNTRLNGNFKLTYDLLPSLKAVASSGYYLLNTDYRTMENIISWYDYAGTSKISDLPARTSYQRGTKTESNVTASGYLEFNKNIADAHSIRAVAGAQYERFEYNRILAKTFDVVMGVPPSLNLSTGDPTSKSVGEAQYHTAIAGYFGRFNYAFKDRYLVEANLRYDGSSKFRPEDRWKMFYGVSLGWVLSEENFIKNTGFFDMLKLRASYGGLGNQSGIGSYDYIQFLNLSFSTNQQSSGFPILGTAPAVRIAPSGTLVAFDRTWEKVENQNVGLDFGILKNRLTGSFDYFVKNNRNMLLNRTYPAVLGASAPQGNNGHLRTWGWDLSLNWRGKIGGLTYRIGGNISDNQNKLLSFGGQNIIGLGTRGYNTAVEGYPIGSYFGLEYAGRIQTTEQLEAYRKYITGNNIGMPSGAAAAQANSRLALGDNMFKDLNGDGKITFPEDAKFLGTDNPRLTYSFNGGAEFKGFDLNFIFQGVGQRTIIRDGNWRIPAAVIFQAQNAAFVDQWWTPSRTDASLPRISTTGTVNNYNYYPSDWIAENGAYLRLKNLVVGYTLPSQLTKKAKLERVRVYFSGNDLWEITKIRDGWDPEATRTVSNNGDGENNNVVTFSQRYPFYRYTTFGLNVTF